MPEWPEPVIVRPLPDDDKEAAKRIAPRILETVREGERMAQDALTWAQRQELYQAAVAYHDAAVALDKATKRLAQAAECVRQGIADGRHVIGPTGDLWVVQVKEIGGDPWAYPEDAVHAE